MVDECLTFTVDAAVTAPRPRDAHVVPAAEAITRGRVAPNLVSTVCVKGNHMLLLNHPPVYSAIVLENIKQTTFLYVIFPKEQSFP